jgi:UDP-glucose 4-epimerase
MTKPLTLLTGATGFVGQAVAQALLQAGQPVVAAVRQLPANVVQAGAASDATGVAPTWRVVGPINAKTDWQAALQGVQTVVHCAARAHVMREQAADALAAYREVNVQGTLRLAQQAAAAGVQRFVFLSSIKVNGEGTLPGGAYSEADPPAPADAYGVSKREAEDALREVAATTGMEVVIVRPPLLVGRGVKGNLQSLAGAIRRGWPVPLGGITDNRRSLLDVRNLADVLVLCATHPQAAGETFLVSDGVPVSTAELVRHVGRSVDRAPRLLPVPVGALLVAGRLLGKRATVERLTGSLLINDAKIRSRLGWTPRFGPADWEV